MNETEITEELREAGLRAWLAQEGIEEEYAEPESYDEATFGDYMILTEAEADERAKDYIEDSLWAFTASWIVDYLPEGVGVEVIEALQPQCEGANDAIRSMVGDRFDELVEDAIAADGRGHFLNTYDGEEHEIEVDGIDWLVYRVN
jgi:hypothetical protein